MSDRTRRAFFSLCAWAWAAAASGPLQAQAPTTPPALVLLAVGAAAPNVSLLFNGKTLPMKALLASNRSVVLFYPGACKACDAQLQEVDVDVIRELGKLGFETFAVSPDLPEDQAKTSTRLSLPYVLVSDPKGAAAKAFHVGGSAAFLIDRDGTVQFVYDLDKTPLKGSDLIAAAKKLKSTSKATAP